MALAPGGGRGKLMFFLRIDKFFPNETKTISSLFSKISVRIKGIGSSL
jgi:hypothetical protein